MMWMWQLILNPGLLQVRRGRGIQTGTGEQRDWCVSYPDSEKVG